MKVILRYKVEDSDSLIYEPEKIEGSWTLSEVSANGDLTIYRSNEYVYSPMPIAHFAAGQWYQAT